jgi:hypothetical protein
MLNAKRLRFLLSQVLLASALAAVGANSYAQVTGPDVVNSGRYAVVYQRKGTTSYLQERVGNGVWAVIATSQGCCSGVSIDLSNKPAADYYYRTYVATTSGRTTTYWTSPEKRVVVIAQASNRDTMANQLRYKYRARIGDINGDGLQDVYITRTSGGSAGNGALQDVILRRLLDGTFSGDAPSAAQLSTASSWPVSSMRIEKGDVNLDGFVDLQIPELGNYIPGAQGQILLSPGGAGPAVQRVVSMTDKFRKFATHTRAWLKNANYFTDNSQTYLYPVYGWVYRCDYFWMNDHYEYSCGGFYDIVGYTVYYDTSWADPDSFFLRWSFPNFSNSNLEDFGVDPGSSWAQNIDLIFTSVFGAQAMNGNWRSYCIDWEYDRDYHPPCVDWGAVIMAAIYEYFPPEPSDWRLLTAGEKLEANMNGLDIDDVDEVRVYNHGESNPRWTSTSVGGDIYVGPLTWDMAWSNDYSIEPGPYNNHLTILVHELAHVWQFRTWGCGAICRRSHRAPYPSGDERNYYYGSLPSTKPFLDYNLEQQAQMVMDRFYWIRGLPGSWRLINNAVTLQQLRDKIPMHDRYP